MESAVRRISYSEKYEDDVYEYRHVILPKELARLVPHGALLSEDEWRALGVCQTPGWQHYLAHRPEPHILLFRRPRGWSDPAVQAALALRPVPSWASAAHPQVLAGQFQ